MKRFVGIAVFLPVLIVQGLAMIDDSRAGLQADAGIGHILCLEQTAVA